MNLDRVRFVTAHYNDLHGLRWIAWGLVCFAVAAENIGWIPTWVMLALILPVGLMLFFGATAYYGRTYGFVKPQAGGGGSLWLTNLIVIALLILSVALDKKLGIRPFIQPFAFAAWFLVMFWLTGREYRGYYLWIAVGMVIANVLLAFAEFPPGSPLLDRGFVTWVLAGIAMIVGGIFDHLLIINTFRQSRAAHE